ncbi:glycosyltransferase family 2 protein [Azospirillum sp. Vi22]|uniref:glycosyltransferase family 2 protein n=1 Tax=Azospirillum baldaniorum TaxID=1064539 RepID=UPI00119CDE06|nr:glycosyltransferase family 2 protein [Azospirillum baldaniorum]NUB05966.1 glycosyltransferase family 2 protein [Azospirillum baldaniorum]TWA69338.1 putative LPLAT superfamily acyltransferase [Azospirillum baldaniorum]
MSIRACAIIPSHNHHTALGGIVAALRGHGLEVILIDDGSGEPACTAIAALHAPADGVEALRLEVNRGKGGAVMAGLRRAHERGFTHAVQVDADGQHDLAAVADLLSSAAAHPDALVSGRPVYDHSVPRSRLIARWATHVWIWVETLSLRVKDSMCGFRVYPLAPTMAVLDSERIGTRMDFDPEIVVRLFWRGVPLIHIPVRVVYPEGNTSNFNLLRDNVLLTRMHTRLVLTMLLRLPSVLRNRPPASGADAHWSTVGERGAWWGMRLVTLVYRLLGRPGCIALLWPVVSYFYATNAAGRRHSLDFLAQANAAKGRPAPSWWDGLRHHMSFAVKALDTFIAWAAPERTGPIDVDGAEALSRLAAEGRGALLIVSHLGNAELSRARLGTRFEKDINVLLHTRHAVRYNRMIRSVRPDAADHTIQVTDIGPQTAIDLKERVERGEWIAIAGDRTPVEFNGRVSRVPFLGREAAFSQGPYVLAALMGCPVYLLFCLREGQGHRVTFEPFAERIELPRRGKDDALAALAARYAQRLEHHCLRDPLQWYNFFDFWADPKTGPR